jgi:hypothetical protein
VLAIPNTTPWPTEVTALKQQVLDLSSATGALQLQLQELQNAMPRTPNSADRTRALPSSSCESDESDEDESNDEKTLSESTPDHTDHILRCPHCEWEVVDEHCDHCGEELTLVLPANFEPIRINPHWLDDPLSALHFTRGKTPVFDDENDPDKEDDRERQELLRRGIPANALDTLDLNSIRFLIQTETAYAVGILRDARQKGQRPRPAFDVRHWKPGRAASRRRRQGGKFQGVGAR